MLVASVALAVALASIGAAGGAQDTPRAPSPPIRPSAAGAHPTLAAPGILQAPQVAARTLTRSWTVEARVGGRPAAWLARRSGVTLMRVDQHLVHLSLHAGSRDGGAAGWTYGDRVAGKEAHLLVAAINGGFKLTYTDVGFMSGGHVAVALKPGLASVVTYSDGTTNIGAWQAGVPNTSKTVFSVLQNQRLLVDHGVAAPTVADCIIECWGGTVGLQTVVARSGLGITSDGQLVWAAGEQLSPAALAAGLIAAGAVRAIELDINPWWVAGYLYVHGATGPRPVPLLPGQRGIAGAFLAPYSRDFLTFVAAS